LKEEYYAWYDPYLYYQHNLADEIDSNYYSKEMHELKSPKLGINEAVGDYQQRYTYATGINNVLI